MRHHAVIGMLAALAACEESLPEDPPPGGSTCTPTPPAPSVRAPSSGRNRLLYTLAVDGLPQLWMLDLDAPAPAPVRLDATGTGPGPLFPGWGPELGIVWSPAGGLVAVRLASGALGSAPLAVIDVDSPGVVRDIGLRSTKLPAAAQLLDEVWSPDGDRLVAVEPGGARVLVAPADGSGVTELPLGLGSLNAPTWAPDGRHVAATKDDVAELYVTPVDEVAPQLAATNIFWWGAAGTQVFNAKGNGIWHVFDMELGTSEIVVDIDYQLPAIEGMPLFSADGTWLMIPGGTPRILGRGCTEPEVLEPLAAGDLRATADGRYFVFTGSSQFGRDGESSAWVAERRHDAWEARHVYSPDAGRAVFQPTVARTRPRAAWRVGDYFDGVFVVTADNFSDPVTFRAEGLRIDQQVSTQTYWFSRELEHIAYLTEGEQPTLRVMDLTDPRTPTLLAEIPTPPGRELVRAAWSADGNTLAFVARDATGATFENDVYVARVSNGALESPQLLGTTYNHAGAAFYWEP